MGKKHNRNRRQQKGPQLSDGERLWKRMAAAIGDKHELFAKAWDAQSIAKLLIDAENMNTRFAKEPKVSVFRSNLDQSLAVIRKMVSSSPPMRQEP